MDVSGERRSWITSTRRSRPGSAGRSATGAGAGAGAGATARRTCSSAFSVPRIALGETGVAASDQARSSSVCSISTRRWPSPAAGRGNSCVT